MKNRAVVELLSAQHNVNPEDITVEFLSRIEDVYEFKATVVNNSLSVMSGFPQKEELKITIKSEPYVKEVWE